MQDRSINNALLALRKQIIQGNGENLAHVEALLVARDVPLPPGQPSRLDRARKNEMRRIVLEALRDGGKTLPELAAIVAERRPHVGTERAYRRVSVTLAKLKAAGLVRREGRVWLNAANFQR